jgi:hypothetical protein
MAESQNFSRNNPTSQTFNIHLETDGHLHFKANGEDGGGTTRMVINDTSGEVAIGGSGQNGQLQIKGFNDENTVFLGGGDGDQVTATLGGGADKSGRILLFTDSGSETVDLNGKNAALTLGVEGVDGDLSLLDNSGIETIRMNADDRELFLTDSNGIKRATLLGGSGRLQLKDSDGDVTVDLQGDSGRLTLGGNGENALILIRDAAGNVNITLDGADGSIDSARLTQRVDDRFETDTAPLTDALDSVLALRGVRYQRKQVTTTAVAGDAQQIGFDGQEVAAACPELVVTNAEGHQSVDFFRLTAVLVEAVKEQQQQIREQAAALEAISEKLGQLSVADQGAGHLK